jgi:hypothetical protein
MCSGTSERLPEGSGKVAELPERFPEGSGRVSGTPESITEGSNRVSRTPERLFICICVFIILNKTY